MKWGRVQPHALACNRKLATLGSRRHRNKTGWNVAGFTVPRRGACQASIRTDEETTRNGGSFSPCRIATIRAMGDPKTLYALQYSVSRAAVPG